MKTFEEILIQLIKSDDIKFISSHKGENGYQTVNGIYKEKRFTITKLNSKSGLIFDGDYQELKKQFKL